MTEITRVPLQPIAKGALTKIWLGVPRLRWPPAVSPTPRFRPPSTSRR